MGSEMCIRDRYYASGTIVAVQDRNKPSVYTFNEANTIEQFDGSGKVSSGNLFMQVPRNALATQSS